MSEAAIGVAIRSCPGVQPRRSYSRLHAIIADSASFANSADRFANNFASDTQSNKECQRQAKSNFNALKARRHKKLSPPRTYQFTTESLLPLFGEPLARVSPRKWSFRVRHTLEEPGYFSAVTVAKGIEYGVKLLGCFIEGYVGSNQGLGKEADFGKMTRGALESARALSQPVPGSITGTSIFSY